MLALKNKTIIPCSFREYEFYIEINILMWFGGPLKSEPRTCSGIKTIPILDRVCSTVITHFLDHVAFIPVFCESDAVRASITFT